MTLLLINIKYPLVNRMAKKRQVQPVSSEEEDSYGDMEEVSEGSMLEEEEEEMSSEEELSANGNTNLRVANKANLLNY